MALVNMFGDVSLESTQQDINIQHGVLLQEILIELKKMNAHFAHLTDQRITDEDVEDNTNVY